MTTVASPPTSAEPPHTYRPVAVYKASRGGLPPLEPYVRGVVNRWHFIWHNVRSDMKAENYGTVLGQAWLILNPLCLAAVFILGRSFIRPMGSPAERNYLIAHLIMGIFVFQFITDGLHRGSKCIVQNKRLILNTSFPRAVFPVGNTLRALLDFIPLLIVLLLARWLLDQYFGPMLLWLPVVVVLLTLFVFGLTLGTSALTVYFRDVGNIITFVTKLWLWSTPILYTIEEIPDGIRPYMALNPLFPFYGCLEAIMAGEAPPPEYLLGAIGWGIGATVVGGIIFMRREREFAVRF